ncbi:hypothetical protein FACS189449_12270 [Alphaproteobacteria bacterium]|nr:hypothetical protein FACS189449_12270 [Alphaproteobacteria bacterium]
MDEPSFKKENQPDWIQTYSNAMYTKYNKDAYKYEIIYRSIPEEEMQFISQFDTYCWPKSTNLKLSFSRFLPYDRCLYLDADIACTNDIKLLWNTDLGTHCVGSCEHDHLLCGREIGVHNGGVMLMDLKKMREYKFTEESAELLKNGKRPGQGRRKMGQWLLYTEEDAFEEYSEKHPDLGILNVDLSFNMCCYFMPREFLGNNAEALVEKIPGMNKGLSNLTLIHYYTIEKADWANREEMRGVNQIIDSK